MPGSALCSVSGRRCLVIDMFLRRAVIVVGGSAAALFASVAVGKRDNDPVLPWTPIPTGSWNSNWDCREPASLIDPSKQKDLNEWESLLQKHTAKADRHIFLIRHGQYNKADHDHDRTLTEKGREQAKLTGKRLKSLDLQFKSIVYSSLTRTTETAEIISRRLPDVGNTPSSLLHEGHPIRPVPECEWQPEHYYFQAGPRIEAAFRKYIHRAEPEQTKDSYEIIVCHDNVIRYFVCRALQIPPDAWFRFELYHGSISKLVIYADGNVSLQMLGEAGYMPPDKLTGLPVFQVTTVSL
uniref:Serine/threonine-protein phosphatase PGAM5, mitochondrial n=1 Tax=Leptobrachium leishanense TaxID=445787 RepID=A0A8C5M7R1_9ANUR